MTDATCSEIGTSARPEPVRVAVACESPMIGRGLQMALGADARFSVLPDLVSLSAWPRLVRLAPDIIVLEVTRVDDVGISAIRRLSTALPDTRLLLVADNGDDRAVARALEAGATGYATHHAGIDHLVEVLLRMASGGSGLPDHRLTRLVRNLVDERTHGSSLTSFLTGRERQILDALTRGTSTPDIAAELSISVFTVRTHIQNILNKLGVHSKLEAAAYAVRNGLD